MRRCHYLIWWWHSLKQFRGYGILFLECFMPLLILYLRDTVYHEKEMSAAGMRLSSFSCDSHFKIRPLFWQFGGPWKSRMLLRPFQDCSAKMHEGFVLQTSYQFMAVCQGVCFTIIDHSELKEIVKELPHYTGRHLMSLMVSKTISQLRYTWYLNLK